MPDRTPQEFFDDLYRREPDPWGLGDRWYEKRKHALTMAALPRARHRCVRGGHTALKSRTEMRILATYTEEAFLLDVFRRRTTPA